MLTRSFFIILFSLILMSCGSADDNPFTGPSKSVPDDAIELTVDNALSTIKATLNALDLVLLPVDTVANSYSKVRSNAPSTPINSPSSVTSQKQKDNNAIAFAPVDISQICAAGGSIRTAGEYSLLESKTTPQTSETGELDITATNCAFSESTVSGVIKSVFDNNVDSNSQASGTRTDTAAKITVIINGQNHTLLSYLNTSIFNNATQLSDDFQAFSFSSPLIGGGILLEDNVAWRQRFSDFFAYQGETLISGANNSTILFTIIDNTQFQLQVDEDGNSKYEFKQVYSWTVLLGI